MAMHAAAGRRASHVRWRAARPGVSRASNRCRVRRQLCRSTDDDVDVPTLPAYSKEFADWFVDTYIRDGQRVGLGTGAWASCCIQAIGERLGKGRLQNVVGVPASDVAASEAAFHGVPLMSLPEGELMDIAFDEVDSIDTAANAFVMGTSTHPAQPQLVRARSMVKSTKKFVALLDDASRIVKRLGGYLPVVIDAEDWETTAEALDDIFIGDAEIWRRPAVGTANPRGGDVPYLSPEGHTIVDVRFYGGFRMVDDESVPYPQILAEIESVPGVVTHGLVLEGADHVVVADATPLAKQLR